MEKEKIRISGFTPKVLVAGLVILAFWGTFGIYYTVMGTNKLVGPWSRYAWFETLFLFVLGQVVLMLLSKITREEISVQEQVVLWSLITSIGLLPWATLLLEGGWLGINNKDIAPAIQAFIPTWLAPVAPDAIGPLKFQAKVGTMAWGPWLAPVMVWFTFIVAFQLFWAFNAVIWRKYFVDVERLPFPVANVVYGSMLVGRVEEMSTENKDRMKKILIGFLIGAIWYLPFLLAQLQKFFPGIITEAAIHGSNPGGNVLNVGYGDLFIPNDLGMYLFFGFNLVAIAFGFFVPLDVLLSGWVTYVLFGIVLPPIMIMSGFLPAPGNGFWDIYWNESFVNGTVNVISLTYGGLVGLAIFTLIFGLRYLVNTFKEPFKPAEGEPVSYGMAWTGLIVSGLVLLGIIVGSGVSIINGLFILIVIYIFYLGTLLVRAYYGSQGNAWIHNWSQTVFALPFVLGGTTKTPQAFYTVVWGDTLLGGATFELDAAGRSLEVYKLAYLSKTPNRSVFLAQIIGIIISTLIVVPMWVFFYSRHGYFGDNYTGIKLANDLFNLGTWTQAGSWPYVGYAFVFGIILTLIVAYMRRTFSWWPLNPVGMVLAFSPFAFFTALPVMPGLANGWVGPNYGGGWFSLLFLPWLVKYIVMRAGGTKMYEKYSPYFIGIILGVIALSFINGLIFMSMNLNIWGSIDIWQQY